MRDHFEIFTAKLAATLNLLFGVTDSSVVLKIAEGYIHYKQSIDLKLEQYLEKKISIDVPKSWAYALESHSIFYSYCYGLFKIVPATILAAGYPVAILMSDSIKSRQSDYFQKLNKQRLHKNGWNTDFKRLSHKDENLLFKMKSLISFGYKIIFLLTEIKVWMVFFFLFYL